MSRFSREEKRGGRFTTRTFSLSYDSRFVGQQINRKIECLKEEFERLQEE